MEAKLNCVDMSRWGGELTAAEAACLREAGVRCVILGTGRVPANAWVGQQALVAATAGLLVECYVWESLSNGPAVVAQACREALAAPWALFVRRWWLDVESPSDISATAAERAIDAGLAALDQDPARRPVGIYTARWWWSRNRMGSKYSGRPLWSAHYDGDPDIDFGSAPYGGWAEPMVEQYQGTTVLCGQSVDLNFHRGLDMPGQPGAPVAPIEEEVRELRVTVEELDATVAAHERRFEALAAYDARLNAAALARLGLIAEAFGRIADAVVEAAALIDIAVDPGKVPGDTQRLIAAARAFVAAGDDAMLAAVDA